MSAETRAFLGRLRRTRWRVRRDLDDPLIAVHPDDVKGYAALVHPVGIVALRAMHEQHAPIFGQRIAKHHAAHLVDFLPHGLRDHRLAVRKSDFGVVQVPRIGGTGPTGAQQQQCGYKDQERFHHTRIVSDCPLFLSEFA